MSVCPHGGGGGVPTLDGRGRGYLSWMGDTYYGQGRGSYLGQGISTLDGGYLPWMGGGVPTLAVGYPPWMGGYLPWTGGTYLGWGGGTYPGGGTYLGWGTPLPCRTGWTGYAVGSTPLAASHRRTFLFTYIFFYFLLHWKIKDFPDMDGGSPTPQSGTRVGHQPIIWPIFPEKCMKIMVDPSGYATGK